MHAGAVMENLQLNGFIAAGVAAAAVCRATCVVGKSMLMPVRALEAIGGFAAVRNVLAEDQVIGVRVRKAGYSIRLSHHVIENVNRQRSFKWFLNRHSRWYKIRRQTGPAGVPDRAGQPIWRRWAWSGRFRAIRASPGEDCFSWSAWAWRATPSRLAGCAARSPSCGTLCSARSRTSCCCPVWFDAIMNRRVHWRGHRFLVGRMTRLRQARVPRQVRRRVWRVRRFVPSIRRVATSRRSDGRLLGAIAPFDLGIGLES